MCLNPIGHKSLNLKKTWWTAAILILQQSDFKFATMANICSVNFNASFSFLLKATDLKQQTLKLLPANSKHKNLAFTFMTDSVG